MLSIFYQDVSQLKSVDFLLINKKSCPLRESMNRHARVNTKNYANEFHAASGVWRNAHSYVRAVQTKTPQMQAHDLKLICRYTRCVRPWDSSSKAVHWMLAAHHGFMPYFIILRCKRQQNCFYLCRGVREIIMDVCPLRSQHRNNMHLGTRARMYKISVLTAVKSKAHILPSRDVLACVLQLHLELHHKTFT
jgi:hypothetical protein